MAAVATGVKIAIAARAHVAKPDALPACKLDDDPASPAVHEFHRAPLGRGLSRELGIGGAG